jgi:hypothetical protein
MRITAKQYFRNIILHDLGFPAETEVIELRNYIIERLSDLKIYKSDYLYGDYINYGKSRNELILNYNSKYNIVNLYYLHFSMDLYDRFGLTSVDIKLITSPLISNILDINVNIMNSIPSVNYV